jgi:TolB-like protein/Tfp pilus assembly protein PilF
MHPGNFFAELKRRNVYKVAVAYAVIAWLLLQGASIILPSFEAPAWSMKVLISALAIGFPIAVVLAWAFEITPEGIKRAEDVPPNESITSRTGRKLVGMTMALALIAAALLVFQFLRPSSSVTAPKASVAPSIPEKSIAVLPFVDMSQAKDQDYFCDGISEEILDALARVDGLRVVARTSSFSFKGRNVDVSEVASKLNVANVLEGSLRRDGNRIRVTAQLISARDGFHIWSETFERELQGVFAVQDEITRAIVDALKIKLAVAAPTRAQPSPAAYDLYLQGLYLSNKTDEQSLRKSLTFFERALEADPNFARAWTGIAKAWLWLADAYVRPLDTWPKVEQAAAKALALDEKDAEAHCYLGEWKRMIGNDPRAEQMELTRALELSPNLATAHMFLAAVHSAECELDEALNEIQIAEKLDPISPMVTWFAVPIYAATGRFDAAVAAGKRLQLNPSDIYFDPPLAEAYRAKGHWQAAAAIYEEAQQQTHSPSSGLAITYAKMGRPSDARRILDELLEKSRRQYVSGETIALIYDALGDREEAFRWLSRACDEHAAGFYTFSCFPEYRALHSDPRFAEFLQRIGVGPTGSARQRNR